MSALQRNVCIAAIAMIVLFLFAGLSFGQETILFSTDFEADNGAFTHSGVVDEWEWGIPVFGVGVSAHSGSRCWGTDLDGRMDFQHDGYLAGPVINLPAIDPTQKIYISFWALVKIDCMNDRLSFFASGDGASWTRVAELFYTMEMGYDENGNFRESGVAEWKKYIFDVSAYAGGPLHLRWQAKEPEGADLWYSAPPHDMAGAYVDDISIAMISGVSHNVQFTMEGWEDPPPNASCPWLSCWNGSEYVKENDIFSTARNKQGEYTDYMALENSTLAGESGSYRLKLSELDEELSFTDMVRLRVVDHAAGVKVGCDDMGNVFTYANPQPPLSAVSQGGSDVLPLVRTKDADAFDGYNGDYIDLNFSNVDISGVAKLVVSATGFIINPERDGTQIPPAPGFEKSGIYVQTKNASGEWENRGYFNVRFNESTKAFNLSSYLPDPAGGYVVRLLVVSCQMNRYHRIDFVALDTSAENELEVHELSPSSAVHNQTGDVLSAILASDNDYLEMKPGEETALDFAIPEQNMAERDFIFVSRGYYIPLQNTFFIFTWDGTDWVLRDGISHAGNSFEDRTYNFDLSLYLPDPSGEYKVRIWQDYRYERAEIDYVGMRVDGGQETLLFAHNYERLPYTVDCLTKLQNSDDNRLTFVPFSMGVRGRTRIVEVRFTGPVCQSIPQVTNLDIGGAEDIYNITNPNPPITWDFSDALAHPQSEYAVRVWTGPGETGTNLWNYSAAGTSTSVTYAGAPLAAGNSYFLRVQVRDNEQAYCLSAWSEIMFRMYCADCEPPVIVRTPETIALSGSSQIAGLPLTIQAWITDNISVQSAKLYYRTTGAADFAVVDMVNVSDSLYSAVIPASTVSPPGVDYYIWASDGTSSTTDPFTNPAASPYQIPVVPNQAPVINHTPVTQASCGNSILISAQVTDNTIYVAEVLLHYRVLGDFIYTSVAMTGSGTYSATIPASATMGASVQYFISAADNYGVYSYAGTFDLPLLITLSGNCNNAPRVSGISVSPGTPCTVGSLTPVFSWTYFDTEGQPQSHYEVEVWSGPGGTGARLWNPPVFAGAGTSITYAGATLQQGNCYYFRVVVRDGISWSEWAELRFCYDNLVLAPPEGTIQVGQTMQFQATGGALPYTFSISDPSICSIAKTDANTCEVTGLAGGTATITVTDDCAITAQARVTVGGECGTVPVLRLTGYRTVSWIPPLWTVQVEVRNNGGDAVGVAALMNEDIPWLTIPDPICEYGSIPSGSSRWGNDSYTFDLTNSPGGSFNVWFDVTYMDACGNRYQTRLDPEFNPGEGAAGQTPVLAYRLSQNYPNPFNPATTINYQIPVGCNVNLQIFDVNGRSVVALVDEFESEGVHAATWNGKDSLGKMVASGIYFYRIKAGDFVQTKRMVLLR